VLDWSAVTQVDSSAVALILELARAAGHGHTLRQPPAGLSSLITLYGVEDLVRAP
jgi:ABC-type transporter Mla MlaB component